MPGSKVPFNKAARQGQSDAGHPGDGARREGRPVARIRDTVNLTLAVSEEVQRKSVQYQTDLELPPGRFTMKVVVRENQTGTLGSFEAVVQCRTSAGRRFGSAR